MVRLIACDIDGTLLQNGRETLPPELHLLIRRLEERGVGFCAASGRQFSNLRELFGPSAERICYVCENGALVYGKGEREPLRKITLTEDLIREAAADLRLRPECEILFSGLNTSYLMLKDPDALPLVRPYLGSRVALIRQVEEIGDEIVQISAYCRPDTAETYVALSPRWGRRLNVAVAGRNWIDFSAADKGLGLEALCGRLGLGPDQVMAFGDNFNDVPMLDLVGYPVIMENAPAPLLERYGTHCRDVTETIRAALDRGAL